MYVLDTNVVSEIRKIRAGRANPGVEDWIRRTPTGLTFVSVITIHELEHGVQLIERRDQEGGAVLRKWLDHNVFGAFKQRILPIDTNVARLAAALHVPDPAPVNDAFVAATAMAGGMAVVTRNQGDFERFDQLQVVNPWSPD
ncbi:type II toxin-antitoxin system VapC family toxin [Candidatus Poriferisocius sp.]|uniref:type II toxin-antitoxin system VapC family toxin n=1 Tax=Candidatus Poriferisocius sp. TaxID=3101276 RepID=UPI003B59B6FB